MLQMLNLSAGRQNLTQFKTLDAKHAAWQSQTQATAQTDQLLLMQEPRNTSLFEAPGSERPS